MNINKRVGTTIRQFRLALGVSTETLADEIGITTSWLAKIESGTQSVDIATLDACARALDMQLNELIQAANDGAQPVVIEVKEDEVKKEKDLAQKSA